MARPGVVALAGLLLRCDADALGPRPAAVEDVAPWSGSARASASSLGLAASLEELDASWGDVRVEPISIELATAGSRASLRQRCGRKSSTLNFFPR